MYGGLAYYPIVPTTCSGALPVFLAGYPTTTMYVCIQGVPTAVAGGGANITSLTGDATAAGPGAAATTVTGINGAAIQASINVLSTNASKQVVGATYQNVVNLFGSGSCSGYLKSDGTCSTPSSIPTGTTNQLLYYATGGTTLTPLNLGTNLSITSGTLNATGGSSVNVNGSAVTNPNFNDTTPAAPSGSQNVTFQTDSNGDLSAYTQATGTVKSVAQTVPSWLAVSGSPVTSSGTLAISAASGQTANEFLATPNGASGAVGLRAIVAADVPTLNQNTTGNAATATALAATPSQCTSGDFATGITASGNANCSGVVVTALTTNGTSGAATLASGVLNIPQYVQVDSKLNSIVAEAGPSGGIPTNPSSSVYNTVLIGPFAGANLGVYVPIVTAGTASSGSTSLTVTSSTGIGPQMIVSGTGIASGTTVTNAVGTTITLSQATTSAVSGNVTFIPGPSGGAIAIGYGALQNATDQTGTVAIGNDAAYSCAGNGQGEEDINGVFIGPAAAYQMNCASSQDTEYMTFEPVIIGNKSAYYSQGLNSTVVIGTHNYAPEKDFSSLYLGSSQGAQFGPKGSGIGGNYSVFLGSNLFNAAPAANNTWYQAPYDVYITPNGADCWYSTNMNTLIGSEFGPNTCTAPVTGTENVVITPGDSGHNYGTGWSSGTGNVAIVSQGATPNYYYGGNITSGSYNSVFGPGAGGNLGAGGDNVLVGLNAGAQLSGDSITAIGANALYSSTVSSQLSGLSAFGNSALYGCTSCANDTGTGWFAGYSAGANANSTYDGYYAGNGDSASNVTYIGANAGERNTSTLGFNEAIGSGEFATASSGTGTEEYDVFVGDQSNCNGCTYGISLGHAATIGAVTGAVQIGTGSNVTANSIQFQNYNFLNSAGAATFSALSVTGATATVNGQNVCLVNGTNCPAISSLPSVSQPAANTFGGSCTMSTATTCTITLGHSYTTPVCIATVQGTTPLYAACSVSGTTVTITASASNSDTWGAMVFGNPN